MLQTQANGATLGVQLADRTQLQFASTARATTFLYSLAVQQMQATSFVTDNYNLDMQWLNTVDQPLLDEALYWTERATAEASTNKEAAIEDNAQASIALQIAAEAPGSRRDMEVTINNAATGNPTQITVYAAGSSSIHDVAPSILSYVESVVSTVVDIAAVVFQQDYLYFAAAAIDSAQAGQDFSNGEDIQGIISLAQSVANGISGVVGTPATGVAPTTAQVTAKVLNAAAQGVGGVYGVVTSAANGNAAGILAGALEAAAAGATGIGIYEGAQAPAALANIAAGLGAAGVAATVASAFDSGNLGQGLVDSLNLYLPEVAHAFVTDQANQASLQAPLQMDSAALAAAGANATADLAPDVSGVIDVLPQSATPPSNAADLTVTSRGVTSTIYVAPASAAPSGQNTGSAPLVVQIVPDATAVANPGSAPAQEDALGVLAALASASGSSGTGQPAVFGTSPLIFSPNAFDSNWDTGIDPTFSELAATANAANAATSGTPNTISASSGQQAQTFMQFLQSSVRAPDFVTFAVSLGSSLGGTGTVSVDRYGDVFVSPGGSAGASATPLSVSLTLNWMNQTTTPAQAQLTDMLTTHGFNVTAGSIGGVSESFTPGTGWATGIGVVSPQAGGSYTYGFKFMNLGAGW